MNSRLTWSIALKAKWFRTHLALSLIGLLLLVGFLPYFFTYLQSKPGLLLHDPILNLIQPRDNSLLVFIIIYGCILLFIFNNHSHPSILLIGLEAYLFVNVIRLITLTVLTLEPPTDIIPLIDPFVAKVAYGQKVFNKDLFFSGHTATLFLLFLLEEKRILKYGLLLSTITVVVLILLQHVHYSIDVLAAPIVSWLSLQLVNRLHSEH